VNKYPFIEFHTVDSLILSMSSICPSDAHFTARVISKHPSLSQSREKSRVMIDELLSSYIVRRMGGDFKLVRRPTALAEDCRALRERERERERERKGEKYLKSCLFFGIWNWNWNWN
jgi:hypothetical protein